MSARITPQTPALQALRMRLHAQHQPVVLMRTDCHVCRAEGLAPRSQVLIIAGDRTVQALLYQIDSDLLKTGQIALSEAAWDALDIHEGDLVQVRHWCRVLCVRPAHAERTRAGCTSVARGPQGARKGW